MAEFLLILAALALYFAPSIVASWRRHPRLIAIFIINMVAGITIVGWIGAFFWALTRGGMSLRRYEYYSERFGGMEVSTSEHLNNQFLVGCGALVAMAAVAAVSLNTMRSSHEDTASNDAQTMPGAVAAAEVSKAPIPYQRSPRDGSGDHVVKVSLQVAAPSLVSSAPASKASPEHTLAAPAAAATSAPVAVPVKEAAVSVKRSVSPVSAASVPSNGYSSVHIHPRHLSPEMRGKWYVDGVPKSERVTMHAAKAT